MEANALNNVAISSRMDTPAGEGILIAWERGWATIELDDGEEKKFRAKDVELLEDAGEGEEHEEVEAEEVEAEEGDEGNNGDTKEEGEEEGAEEEEDGEEGEESAFKGERLRQRKEQYVGKRHCGDEVALALAGATLQSILALTVDLGLYSPKWAVLNPGQQRMNAGNRLRGWLKKNEGQEAVFKKLVKKPAEFQVLRNGRPAKRCESREAAERWMATAQKVASNPADWAIREVA